MKFTADGWVRPLYYVILITHLMLAFHDLAIGDHYRDPSTCERVSIATADLGRFTMPIWLYVSVTGVIVYFMLYQWYPFDTL